ncbi:sugar ABC transporter substrate-binding protein [Cryptosporangium sp. NPDC048952]|uniref:sugar ABC transporter substrate-binding protein n=1 Tax=Cryptosporangium sp. NPDC048952 TaxID=3363961 RepID=UPI0037148B05
MRLASARAALVLLAALLSVAACGPGETSTSSDTSAVSDELVAQVKKLSGPVDTYVLPTEPLGDVSRLTGKTVYYIPITVQAKQFTISGNALRAALATVGVKLQICNGNSNPSDVAACVAQATAANAGAIVTDSIPYALAANAFDAAQAKKIPVLITDQIPDPAHPASATLGYLEGGGRAMMTALADWIIVDSGAKATVVVNVATDTPSTVAYVESAQQEFTAHCPDCKLVLNKISSANFNLIASTTSSALLRTPDAKYLVSEFDQFLQPTQGGAQQAGKIAAVKGGSTAGGISGLKTLEAKNFLHVDVLQASTFQGWATADAALRMMLGSALPKYDIPIRIIDRENVGSIKITDAAEESGEWFGATDFPAKFTALWKAT